MDIASIRQVDAAGIAATPTAVPAREKAQQQELIHAVKAVNESGLLGVKDEMTFAVDRDTRRTVVRVVNKETREVLLQIPDEQVLRMAAQLSKS